MKKPLRKIMTTVLIDSCKKKRKKGIHLNFMIRCSIRIFTIFTRIACDNKTLDVTSAGLSIIATPLGSWSVLDSADKSTLQQVAPRGAQRQPFFF